MNKKNIFKQFVFVLFLLIFNTNVSSQNFLEDFNYTASSTLTSNGYTVLSAGGTNAITVTTSGLNYGGSPSSGVGNAAAMVSSGEDLYKDLSTAISTGDLYASLFVNVSAAQANGDYFFVVNSTGSYIARLYIKSSGSGFVFGIGKSGSAVAYETTVRSFNTVHLVVVKYTFNSAATDDVINVYVNPNLGSTEPAATIANIGAGTADATTLNRIALRQGAAGNAATLIIDGIRIGTTWAAVTPVAIPTISSITPTNENAGAPGFILTVNGTNFINNNSKINFNGNPVTTTYVSETQLTANIPATSISSASVVPVTVVTTGASAVSNAVNFTINASSGASLLLVTPLNGFGNICINNNSLADSFNINGSNLNTTNISVDVSLGYTFSETLAGVYSNSINFSYTGNSFADKKIYVIFTPTFVQSYNTNILLNGGGIVNYPITSTGAGINNPPNVVANFASIVTASTAILNGTINNIGCAPITSYGFEYSTISGFTNGTGTQVLATNLLSNNFSVPLIGLVPNTRYYFKSFATNIIGTTYSVPFAFTCTPLPVPMAAQPNLSFTENFADIANWNNFFIDGIGANHFDGLSATGTGAIPNPLVITSSTSSFVGPTSGGSGGVQKGSNQIPPTETIVLLATGATDNTTSTAIDFYMDFTGVNAGTLSFDWATVFNSSGDRNGSLKVYASVDGVTFSDIPFAAVTNITNNITASGSKTNIALPVIFNNSPNAILRFYYYNATGGITPTGSRPKISIDKLNITAVATTPCVAPTAVATNLIIGTVTDVSVQISFTGTASADGYLVLASLNSVLTAIPIDIQNYSLGDNIGDAFVVAKGAATSFNITGLTPSTEYYFFIFPLKGVCTGGPLYYITTPLNGVATTTAGLPTCIAPSTQIAGITFITPNTSNSIQGGFTPVTANGYLIIRSTASSLTTQPINAQIYNSGDIIGNGMVVQSNSNVSFIANNLIPNTQYYFFIYAYNNLNCINGPIYNIVNPTQDNSTTLPLPPCIAPSNQPANLILTASNNAIAGTFSPVADTDNYLVIKSLNNTLSASPIDNTNYNIGDAFGGGEIIANSINTSFLSNNLIANTQYYFFVFANNKNCSGGTKFATATPLVNDAFTTNLLANNVYFGNLHAHSMYSDGENLPSFDYDYADNALCMDFLGISEHNHNTVGTTLNNYRLGTAQSNAYTAANPNFLALYGMEWGVISGGGHVLIYGNGMDKLFGWENGTGAWGATSNYDEFVGKSIYLGNDGIFKKVNDNIATNTFITLAHPGLDDFNKLANNITTFNSIADDAIVGVAIESGPSTSSNTTYSNPAFSLGYLWYYQTMLSKGYHLGPTVDHDNHKTTFGRTTYSRTAVIMPTLNKTSFAQAMRNMHFYATQDCDSKVNFSINTKIMGSTFSDKYAPNIYVTLTDPLTPTNTAVIRLMYGVPGSNIMPIKIDSVIGNTYSYTDNNIANLTTGYYYIDIVNGTSRIITAPIWYTRNDNNFPLAVQSNSFTAQKEYNQVKLLWKTKQETGIVSFVVEKSIDNGVNWSVVDRVVPLNNNLNNNYFCYDKKPSNGVNIYRLKNVEISNKINYSYNIKINFIFKSITIAPNPAKEKLLITHNDIFGFKGNIVVSNLLGQSFINQKVNTINLSIPIDITHLLPGVYLLKLSKTNGDTIVEKFIKE